MSTMGVILSTMGDVQYHGDIMMHVGGYHEYREDVQYCGGKIFCYLSTAAHQFWIIGYLYSSESGEGLIC